MSRSLSTTGLQYDSVDALYAGLGATRPIRRVLVANNGLAAVKGIDSIRSWMYEQIGDQNAIEFVVMATPEDLQGNAEFISMAEHHVPVPGGPNSNNYANIDLIMQTALQNSCDAIYPGWGHASENPALPRECARTGRVTFLGPAEDAMFALGDKIASTIVAQSNGVPTVPWSGDTIKLQPGVFNVDPVTYEKAYVTTPEECESVCRRIGFPVMIKASEGGGGKGIRHCKQLSEVKDMFFAVSEEVRGCHIFVMRMLENVRHLEVQLLADKYGNCIAVRTRDCSVQRRHQKIIEEGPAFDVDPEIIKRMEQAAIQLAKAVNYCGLGTVEYMYDKGTHEFYFLELNPRIQVEHPVSELISGVNLPAALLCVGMGVRLDKIPEVRTFFNERPYETTPIDFTTRTSLPPKGHTIAVRITAEDTDEGFRPTSGRVEEISFKNSKECWGYFSVNSGGEIHQFSDSQFGHIFSSGETREDARRGMALALRNLVIRGEIRTSSAYVLDLIESADFRNCKVSTAWLDRLIAERNSPDLEHRNVHVALIAASVFRNLRFLHENAEKYTSFLAAGHVPSRDYLSNYQTESYVSLGEKYIVRTGKISPNEYTIALNDSFVNATYRALKSGALQLIIGPKSVVAYAEEEPNNLRITIGGKVTNFTGDLDPTKVLASVPGRLVRYVIENDGHVSEGGTFAEVEVMKMILPLRANTPGVLHHRAVPGSTIAVGSLLAEITPDDPSKVARPRESREPWSAELLIDRKFERPDGATRARRAVEGMWNMLHGYHFKETSVEGRIRSLLEGFSSIFLSSVTLSSIHLPFIPEMDPASPLTPTDKVKTIFDVLISRYVEMENYYDDRTRQESIDQLRTALDDPAKVYEIDFAHNQDCHHEVIKGMLRYLEGNHVLLKSLYGTLKKLVELKSYNYGSLLLQARYLLRQCTLPSFAERKTQFARELEDGSLNKLVTGSYGYDLMCSVMFDHQMHHLVQVCLELFIRREYFDEGTIKHLDIFQLDDNWHATYTYEQLEEGRPIDVGSAEMDAASFGGNGVCMVFIDEQKMRSSLRESLKEVVQRSTGGTSVCTVFLAVPRRTTQEEAAGICQRTLDENADVVREVGTLHTVYFIVHGIEEGPHVFTFRQETKFKEDTLLRNVMPQSARRLELDRLSNFDVTMYPTPYKEVHLFKGTPKKKGWSQLETRIFARVAVTPHDMGMEPWTEGTEIDAGHMLTKCLAALEVARDDVRVKYPASNHVFVRMIKLTFDVSTLQKLLVTAATSYLQKLITLGVAEMELAFHVKVGSGLIPMRVIVTSPSGFGIVVHVYCEVFENGVVHLRRAETSEDVTLPHSMSNEFLVELNPASPLIHRRTNSSNTFRALSKLDELRQLLPATKKREVPVATDEDNCGGNGEGRGALVLGPYPLLNVGQVKRLQARVAKTTYVHDWPVLLSLIARKQWSALRHSRGLSRAVVPANPLLATQLFLREDGCTLGTGQAEGAAPCGMKAWIVDYTPAAYYDLETQQAGSRQFVMVANDITFQSGSFAVPEDAVFKAASVLARQQRVPFVYVSANSGARLGLSADIKRKFLVAFTESNEIDYLYLTAADYAELQAKGVAMAVEEVRVGGETRFAVRGIVGAPTEYIGVENLRGSGLVAGEMSKSYSEIPTISVVSGRSVGIGAYLNRLGRRVIQTYDAPLILTGAQALNRLLGKEVYIDNSQLGGRQIMVPNGVTHWNTKHDHGSARMLLRWIDFVPAVSHPTRCLPLRLTGLVDDPVDRDVTFAPQVNTAYDPRFLVTGSMERTGMFDRGSWVESLEGWAKTVVTGRATLGGIPCGVIVVETRLTKKFDPADPADPTSTSSFVAQAGQVWFPDSARKTADALDDFHHEQLPCFILANWRGFSGGMRDMFDEVLKFGASIVDNLRVYTAPVFIYIPPFGELRGGAWVVVDPVINHNRVVEMYCDPSSRGGILEPSAVVEIKFRDNDVRELIRRCHPELATMEPTRARQRESQLLPKYRDVAVRFADLHDNEVRMKAIGVVRDAVPWKDSRRYFHAKLQRKLLEIDIANDLVEAGLAADLAAAIVMIEERYYRVQEQAGTPAGSRTPWGTDDVAQFQWLQMVREQGGWAEADDTGSTQQSRLGELRRLLLAGLAERGSAGNCFTELFENPQLARAAQEALDQRRRFNCEDVEEGEAGTKEYGEES